MGRYPIGEGEEIPELVEPIEEAMLGERINRKTERRAARENGPLLRQIDSHDERRIRLARPLHLVVGARLEGDGDEPVLERILAKDIGKRARDDRPKAPI